MGGRRVRPWTMLVSPVFACSVAVLLFNDHVLKAWWPGVVTGKLSDVAGVVMVALALTAAGRRAGPAFGLTVAAFTALKTVPAAAVWAAPVLGGVTRTDPTDLVALFVLVPTWVWVHRADDDPMDGATWTAPVRVALIGAAVFAVSATSCDVAGVTRVTEHRGAFFAADTGGVVFTSTDGLEWDRGGGRGSDGPPAAGWTQRDDCAGGRCFAIEGTSDGIAVVEVGAVRPLLELTRDQQLALAEVAPQQSCSDVSLFHLAAAERPDGVHVVVSIGSAGVVSMAADGTWRWAAVGDWGVRPDAGSSVLLGLEVASEPTTPGASWGRIVAALVPGAVLAAALATAAVLARRSRRRGGRWSVVVAAIAGMAVPYAVLYGALARSAADGSGNDVGVSISYLALAGVGAAAFAMGLAIAGKWARPPEPRDLPPPDG